MPSTNPVSRRARRAVAFGVAMLMGAAWAGPAFGDAWGTDSQGNLYRVLTRRKEIVKHGQVRVGAAPAKPTTPAGTPGEGAGSESEAGASRTPTTPAARMTGGTVPTLTDLALSPSKGMYGISYSTLYKIDVDRPAFSRRIGALGPSSVNACAFDGQGRLWAAGGTTLYTVDLKTGRATAIGSMGIDGTSDGDLAWIGNRLFATVGTSRGTVLATLDPKTGRATATLALKDELGAALHGVWGLAFDGRELWALSSVGRVYRVNRETGVLTYLMTAPAGFYGACPTLRL